MVSHAYSHVDQMVSHSDDLSHVYSHVDQMVSHILIISVMSTLM